jgi:hypothetical protein
MWQSRGISSCINFGIGVVHFTPNPLYSQGKKPQYPLNKKLGQPETFYSEKRNLLPMPEIEP